MIELKTTLDVNLGLILTPRLDLSLKILAMNVTQIEEHLKKIMTENPLVKLDEGIKVEKRPLPEDKFKEIEESYRQHFDGEDFVSDIIEVTVSKEETLEDKLLLQLRHELSLTGHDEEIARHIIYNINEKGFLALNPQDIADKLKVSIDRVEFLRRQVMNLEPLGCGCLDSKEFLLLQAESEKDVGLRKRLMELIDTLEGIKKPNLKKIRDILGWPEDLFREVIERFRGFMLYPLEYYTSSEYRDYIEPDIYVKRVNSELVAILNDRGLSGVSIDEEMLNVYLKDGNAEEFIKEKYKQIKEFMLAVSNRNKTLLKTVNVILKRQRKFFEDGTIMPLTRKEIAAILGFNVSTITRAVANKYLEFEGKILPLSKFFSSGISESVSKDYVKDLIEKMIKDEDKLNPLSDDQIKEELGKMGINLTRRTITKYRKEMNIPSSRERKCQDML
ncbi:RNA polymerase factor sigma-54 [Hippea maritima]|uniref:RNA polymerase, sigma 54 subunit, RpoN n=1 Tax=Hippea maritima (strain ATCC 700847 / DSM 10411 / MH2) TaxID=760142 RepID=F2LUB0_HIPMA|nr:RNA polymerase factor sigma-54 [Hippea maritima]AEA33436.1 RNA polymerase, sigma 54 subunit, RpoN [Hippea maritima DSM 10411]